MIRTRTTLLANTAKGLLLFGALATAGSTSCFFVPRDAEPGGSTTRWEPARDPLRLVTNIEVTMEDQQIEFYDNAFSDTFLFRADRLDSIDEASAGSESTFVNWTEEVERVVADNIFNAADSISLTLTNLSPPDSVDEGGSIRLRKNYELSIVDVNSVQTLYKGTLTFYMNQPGSDWVLYRWEDARAPEPGIPSWGQLRARNK